MGEIVIVGAGIAGLGAALALGRQGRHVILCERDAAPVPATAEEMWSAWHGPGVAQAPLGHSFLPRLTRDLRAHAPDVLERLWAVGAAPLDLAADLPGGERLPEDTDLTGFLCRRIVLEGLLRQAVEAEPTVELRTGCAVAGLLAQPSHIDGVPRVMGVRTRDGGEIAAETVVLAGGRLQAVPDWLAAIGARMPPEEAELTGRVTYARHFRVCPGEGEEPTELPRFVLERELGYLLYFLGGCDRDTFCVEFVVPAWDADLHGLHAEAAFMAAAHSLPDVAPWLAHGRSTPIGPVEAMGQERNLLRRFMREGQPVALGLHVIGDARCQTNNVYGLGVAVAFSQAMMLADILAVQAEDALAQAYALEERVAGEVAGLHRQVVANDRAHTRTYRDEPTWEAATAEGDEGFIQTVVVPAANEDATIFRAYRRRLALLDPPDALARNTAVLDRARELAAVRQPAPQPPDAETPRGPTRDELLRIMAEARARGMDEPVTC